MLPFSWKVSTNHAASIGTGDSTGATSPPASGPMYAPGFGAWGFRHELYPYLLVVCMATRKQTVSGSQRAVCRTARRVTAGRNLASWAAAGLH